MLTHTDIINNLISKYNYKTYLEIGVSDPNNNFVKINIEHKDGVDPYFIDDDATFNENWKDIVNYIMTSDDFFKKYYEKTYDIIFIDGLHTEEQTDKDIFNSIYHLNKGGTIVIHDCLPWNENSQKIPRPMPPDGWVGTTWKSIIKATKQLGNKLQVIDTDCGCGIITDVYDEKYHLPEIDKSLTYKKYENNRLSLINIINENYFCAKYLDNNLFYHSIDSFIFCYSNVDETSIILAIENAKIYSTNIIFYTLSKYKKLFEKYIDNKHIFVFTFKKKDLLIEKSNCYKKSGCEWSAIFDLNEYLYSFNWNIALDNLNSFNIAITSANYILLSKGYELSLTTNIIHHNKNIFGTLNINLNKFCLINNFKCNMLKFSDNQQNLDYEFTLNSIYKESPYIFMFNTDYLFNKTITNDIIYNAVNNYQYI